MKRLLLLFLSLAPVSASACMCSYPPTALEFLQAKHVFWGHVTKKVYAKDSLTYEVKLTVDRHFKKGMNVPKTFRFAKKAEGKYTGEYTSCDYNVNKGESWLIYTFENDGKLDFTYTCSNSKPIKTLDELTKRELEVLETGNDIDLDKITFGNTTIGNIAASQNYQRPVPRIPLDTLLNRLNIAQYDNKDQFKFENFILTIDLQGRIQNIVIPDRSRELKIRYVYDIPHLVYEPINNLTPLQQDLINKIMESQSWHPARFIGRNVHAQVSFQVSLDDDKKFRTSVIR